VTRQQAVEVLQARACVIVHEPHDYADLAQDHEPSLSISFFNSCRRKHRYPSERAAKIAAKKIENPLVHAYACGFCLGFHCGKSSEVAH
jgi:hypothetical protein